MLAHRARWHVERLYGLLVNLVICFVVVSEGVQYAILSLELLAFLVGPSGLVVVMSRLVN